MKWFDWIPFRTKQVVPLAGEEWSLDLSDDRYAGESEVIAYIVDGTPGAVHYEMRVGSYCSEHELSLRDFTQIYAKVSS